jgi:hypothetical protein
MLRLLLSILSTHLYETWTAARTRGGDGSAHDEDLRSRDAVAGGGQEGDGGVRYACFLADFLAMQAEKAEKKDEKMFNTVIDIALRSLDAAALALLKDDAVKEGYETLEELCFAVLSRDRVNIFNLPNADGEDCGECHFPAAAMLNHSCIPNAEVKFIKGSAYVLALRRIPKHAEVLHSYVPLNDTPLLRRQQVICVHVLVCPGVACLLPCLGVAWCKRTCPPSSNAQCRVCCFVEVLAWCCLVPTHITHATACSSDCLATPPSEVLLGANAHDT